MGTEEQFNTFKGLDTIFGTSPTIVPAIPAPLPVPVTESSSGNFPPPEDLADDYNKARNSLRNLLDKGDHVVDNMIQIAVQTESARGFEVAGNLIKAMADVAKDLVAMHKQVSDIRKKTDDTPKTPQVVNNTQQNVVLQGSTSDLFEMIKAPNK